MTAEEQSDKMVSDMEVHRKQRCIIKFTHAGQILPIDNHQHLLNAYGDQTVDVSTVKAGQCGQHFPSNNAIVAAGKQWVTSAGADFYEHSTQALVLHQ